MKSNNLLLGILAVLIIGVAMFFVLKGLEKSDGGQNQPTSPAIPVVSPTSPTQPNGTSTVGMKIYTNTEFGFEFEYPQDLIIRENSFGSYYSKFNLELLTKIGEQFDSTFLVNIVLPEFTDRSFRNIEKTVSEITVVGIQGVKYQYEYQGFLHTTVILPLGELQMILATGEGSKQYLNEFNQILTSFKFLYPSPPTKNTGLN